MNKKWNYRFLDLAKEISKWSKDPSTCVGAIIVDYDKNVRAMGYNGFPRGVHDTEERLNNRDLKYPLVVHAERNAITSCARLGIRTEGCILVCTHFPCSVCAGEIINAGIVKIIVEQPSEDFKERWEETNKIALEMFNESGVELLLLENQNEH